MPSGGKPALLDQLREGSSAFAKELGHKLRQHIFDDVFPYLAQGFVDYRKQKFNLQTAAGDDFLTQTYDATLTLLYRLLFLLYSESLDLLPVNEPAYAELSLTRLKGEIADHGDADGDTVESRLKTKFTKSDTNFYDRIAVLPVQQRPTKLKHVLLVREGTSATARGGRHSVHQHRPVRMSRYAATVSPSTPFMSIRLTQECRKA